MSRRSAPQVATIVGWTAIILFAAIYIAAYVWLALAEERHAKAEFGDVWEDYAGRTARFIPGLV